MVQTATRKPRASKQRNEQTVTTEKVGKPKARKSRVASTFEDAALDASFVHFCQLVAPETLTEVELAAETKRLLGQEIELIHNAEFPQTGFAKTLFPDGRLIPQDLEPNGRGKMPDLPSHLARLCEARLLTSEEERLVFLRMNFLRFKAFELRAGLNADAPCAWTIRRIQALLAGADWYRDRMVKSNMRLVISIVKKFVNKQNGFDDLLSDGIVALLRAVDKFDVGLGFRFSTYATQVVRRNTYRRVMEKQKERQRVAISLHDSGVDISDEHRSSGMSEQRWHDLRSRLGRMLDLLDRREKLIVRARFSLGGHRRVQTLQRLADKLGVSKERVRQLEKRALDKLRDLALESPLPDTDA